MKKCCFVIPYFGKLPDYFQIFLNSCSYNMDYDWLLLTDDNTPYTYPNNVLKIYQTFDGIKKLIQSKFDFPIKLDEPHKLCDYKPAYGYLFEDYLKDYLFWGHCDVDTIMGDLNAFLDDDLLECYDKIFCLGHMTLYRNTNDNNRLFMSKYKGRFLYKEVFSCPQIMTFDEEWRDEYNVNQIFLSYNKRVLLDDYSLNFSVYHVPFRRIVYTGLVKNDNHGYNIEKYRKALYLWEKGKVLRYTLKNNSINMEEYLYVHLQMRKMTFEQDVLSSNILQIVPNSFLVPNFHEITYDLVKRTPKFLKSNEMIKLNRSKKIWRIHYYLKKWMWMIKNNKVFRQ